MKDRLGEQPLTLSYDELLALPRTTVRCDIHCVTTWSRFDNAFEGVAVQLLLEHAASRCSTRTSPGSGSRTAITYTEIRGRKSAMESGGSRSTISIG